MWEDHLSRTTVRYGSEHAMVDEWYIMNCIGYRTNQLVYGGIVNDITRLGKYDDKNAQPQWKLS